jgi:hypothetical protein
LGKCSDKEKLVCKRSHRLFSKILNRRVLSLSKGGGYSGAAEYGCIEGCAWSADALLYKTVNHYAVLRLAGRGRARLARGGNCLADAGNAICGDLKGKENKEKGKEIKV